MKNNIVKIMPHKEVEKWAGLLLYPILAEDITDQIKATGMTTVRVHWHPNLETARSYDEFFVEYKYAVNPTPAELLLYYTHGSYCLWPEDKIKRL